MGDKALRGNRLTAQGGGHIAGPARRAQESGFYSPDMGMRGKFGYKHGKRAGYAIGSIIKGAKKIISKVIKPKEVDVDKLLKNLGDEIKAQPIPPKIQSKIKELQKAYPHKKASGGRIGLRHGGSVGAAVRGHGAEIK